MEEFSQSRGDDDLFDDEIVPIEPSSKPVEASTEQVKQVSLEPLSSEATESTHVDSDQPTNTRARGRGRGRGRGQARDQPRSGGLGQSKYATKPTPPTSTPARKSETAKASDTAQSPVAAKTAAAAAATEDASSPTSSQPASSTGPPPSAPTGPANPTPSRPPAVRGDRTSTGGVRKPKLTEAELNEKLAAAKERSQNLAAAHARAQADAESFAERERVASEKRVKETQERKAMEGERERNRERKLRALGGREWDAGKDEQDFNNQRPSRRQQGDVDGDADNDLSMYEWKEDRGRGRGRGRGARGVRGGGGRGGRGGYVQNGGKQTQPDLSAEADFPALPASNDKPASRKPDAPKRKDSAPVSSSWADQVESSEAAGQ